MTRPAALVLLGLAGAVLACEPDESSVGGVLSTDSRPAPVGGASCSDRWVTVARHESREAAASGDDSPVDVESVWDVPLSAVTGVAASLQGLVVGGVSREADVFWDAWVVPFDGGTPRRLAPIGNNLVAVDASGALWTTINGFDASGKAAYEIRVSPSDGSPSVRLSPELPPDFVAERAVADGEGGRLLVGSEERDGAMRGAVYAVDAAGRARRVACDPRPEPALFLAASLAPDGLTLVVQYSPEGPSSLAKVRLR